MSVLRTRSHVASARAEGNPTGVSVVWMSLKTALASTEKRNTSRKMRFFNFNTKGAKDADVQPVFPTTNKPALRLALTSP